MPTFDFHNIIRKLVVVGSWSLINPITIFLVLSSAIALVLNNVVGVFDHLNLPQIDGISLTFLEEYEQTGIKDLVFYCFSVDKALSLINSVIQFVNYIVPFSITTLVSFLSCCFIYRCSHTVRNALTTIVH